MASLPELSYNGRLESSRSSPQHRGGLQSSMDYGYASVKPVQLGICGLGTVGSGVVRVLQRNRAELSARAGRDLVIRQIGARRDRPDCDTTGIAVTRDVFEVVRNPEVEVVLELIGGTTTARELVLEAIAQGKHVVTANKALIAEHGNELFAAARERGVMVQFEAGVAGGIPIIKAIREGLAANRIEWLAGIINGTGNFILTEMRAGRSFGEVLSHAQALGYAEADPTFDVEGIDAAHKLVILAALAFGMPLQFDKVYTEGISRLSLLDVEYAEELGYRIKHLGIARRTERGVELRVHPTLVPESLLLANVNGVMNAVLVQGDAVGPTLYYGAGAGAEPTASAVLADVVDVARQQGTDPASRVPFLAFHDQALETLPVLPIDEVESAWYLRMSALDQPGVLSRVASILSEAGISIEALIQKAPLPEQDHVPLILLTNPCLGASMDKAVARIEALDSIDGAVVRLRTEPLAG